MNEIRKYINIVEMLTESHYVGPLYHSTSFENLLEILVQGYLWFQSDREDKISRKFRIPFEYEYVLSTSRDKNNSFKKNRDVTFVLRSDFFRSKKDFIIRPVNFFNSNKRSEAEERIWSKKQHISYDECIAQIHINLQEEIYNIAMKYDDIDGWDENDKIEEEKRDDIDELIGNLDMIVDMFDRKRVFFYKNYEAYDILNTRKAMSFADAENYVYEKLNR